MGIRLYVMQCIHRSLYYCHWLFPFTRILYRHLAIHIFLKKGKRSSIAVNGTPSQSYGTSLAIWDHTVLPANRYK